MYHSIKFGDKNTWDDWHLIPSTRPVINPPEPKYNFIDIPGRDGSLDGSEILTGYPVFKNRTGSLEFIVANDYWNSWIEAYSTILKYLHGKRMKAILEDDPNYYYEGRFSVNNWKSDKNYSLIVIDYNVEPYKKSVLSSADPWLWDPFNFNTGVIRSFVNIHVDGSLTLHPVGSEQRVIPVFISSDPMTVTYLGVEYQLEAGRTQIPEIQICPGENELVFTGTGTISIEYREGEL